MKTPINKRITKLLKANFKTAVLTLLLAAMVGCTIQKREHLSGYHVEWYKSKKEQKSKDELAKDELAKVLHSRKIKYQGKEFSVLTQRNDHTLNRKMETAVAEHDLESNGVEQLKLQEELQQEHSLGANQGWVTPFSLKQKRNSGKKKSKINERESLGGDALLYTSTGLTGLGSFVTLWLARRRVKRFTKWAKKNPKKTQALIAGIQAFLGGTSLYTGYNLHQMGYEISNLPMYVSAGVLGLALASIPFTLKREEFILPQKLKRRRMSYMAAMLASMMMLAGAGNKVEENYPNSYLASTLASVDQVLFDTQTDQNDQLELSESSNFSKSKTSAFKAKSSKKSFPENEKSSGERALIILLSLVLGLLLLAVAAVGVCAGICIIAFSLSPVSILGIVGGALLAILCGVSAGAIIWKVARNIKENI